MRGLEKFNGAGFAEDLELIDSFSENGVGISIGSSKSSPLPDIADMSATRTLAGPTALQASSCQPYRRSWTIMLASDWQYMFDSA